MALANLVREVADLRVCVADSGDHIASMYAYIENEMKDDIALNLDLKRQLSEAEEKLRAAVLEASEEEVKATPGVGIRTARQVIYDELTALDFAIGAGEYLLLDKKAFEAAMRAKKGPMHKWVSIVEEKQATIARDLSGVL